ncbi:TIGR00156 family protein [Pseudovibrio denitrificans]|uniref:TIGR00156 family protein n=1 Tax=Pseudovibrio denitrificans TaxID=258256 RepID=A0A1I7BW88_9HYPH|nr:NirD/YgiW/YdeI family stress tolerance protein [Pseudovibrio denitrificans]SFT91435.1 TIGR00156 family protein [Pseudovibrio denitrificans]
MKTRKKLSIIAATTAVTLASPFVVLADDHRSEYGDSNEGAAIQYTGPVAVAKVSMLSTSLNPFKDDSVVLEGKLTRQIDESSFVFDDGSGVITVHIDDHERQNPLTVSASDMVRVFGEVEGWIGTPSIRVHNLQIVQ